jgi:hypothetical protein
MKRSRYDNTAQRFSPMQRYAAAWIRSATLLSRRYVRRVRRVRGKPLRLPSSIPIESAAQRATRPESSVVREALPILASDYTLKWIAAAKLRFAFVYP